MLLKLAVNILHTWSSAIPTWRVINIGKVASIYCGLPRMAEKLSGMLRMLYLQRLRKYHHGGDRSDVRDKGDILSHSVFVTRGE